MKKLYPLMFEPILKEKVWGGKKLQQLLGRNGNDKIGESWDISGVEGSVSIVKNGSQSGKSLISLIETYKETLVGKKIFDRFGTEFPLLFKFIDAAQDLSVQLHPNDVLAKKRHNSFGKTEMWYVLQAEENARLILGFNNKMNEANYLKALSENRITEILNSAKVSKDDAFFLKPGLVHAIGAGILLAEIQQTSDITYRIYDWDRPDNDGKMRELHNDLALKAIDYSANEAKVPYTIRENEISNLVSNTFFETNKLLLTKPKHRDLSKIDCFVVYMCVEGEALIEAEGFSEKLKIGDTILIPASFAEIVINTTQTTLLEVYIP